MSRQLALTLLSLFVLAGITACGGSGNETPETIALAETDDSAISPTPTPTVVLIPPPTPTPTTNPVPKTVLTPISAQPSKVTPSATETAETRESTHKPTEVAPYAQEMSRERLQAASKHSICHPVTYYDPNAASDRRNGSLLNFDYYNSRGYWAHEDYIRWSPDGSRILFGLPNQQNMRSVDLYSITADGSRLEKVVDTSAKEPDWLIGSSMTYFDMSPDGSRLAFSACTHHRDPATEYLKYNSLYRDWPRGWAYNYDMALANIDGTEMSRLTETPDFENFPVWSPDGSRIAYISSPARSPDMDNSGRGYWILGQLTIHTLSTGETRSC